MSFGNIIKKLRLDREMTQEQLAEVLSISPQAISRWETNIALPDISLLPALANFFDVTTDYLLEVDISNKEKEINFLLDNARMYTAKGEWSKGIEVLRAAIKKYPSSHKLMNELAYALYCLPQETSSFISDVKYTKLIDEIISIEETVLDNSKDTELRHSAIQLLCMVYGNLNMTDNAEALASAMPSIYQCKEELLASLYKGTKRFTQQQDNIFIHLDLLLLKLACNNAPLDDHTKPYTYEEMILLNKKIINILDIIFEDKNYGFFAQKVAWTYLNIAWFYAKLNNKNQTLKYLALAKEQSIINDTTSYIPCNKYTCLVFKEKKYGSIWHNISLNDSQHQLKEMEDCVYDFIRDSIEFKNIIDNLSNYANHRRYEE